MQCPVCGLDQVIVEWRGVEVDLCIDGHGLWFDADELQQLFAGGEDGSADSDPDALRDRVRALEDRLLALPHADGHGDRRACPRCNVRMHHVEVASAGKAPVVLDACPNRDGIWFDDGELEAVLESDAFAGVDGFEEALAFLREFCRPAAQPGDRTATED